jgi:segregation and condensation protein B
MNTTDAKRILETALICSPHPLAMRDMRTLFEDALNADSIRLLLRDLQHEYVHRGVELVSLATGWRLQSRPECVSFLIACTRKNHPVIPDQLWRPWPSLPINNR